MDRHAISDEHWERIEHLLPGRAGDPGVTAKDNRLFIDAVLWIGKTGSPWRDLPRSFGKWNSVWRRFDRWCTKGVWHRVFEALKDPDLEWLILDSTVIRAHQHAARAAKKTGAWTKRWDGREAASGPSCISRSTAWATPSSSC